jgi:hypothetical protein
VGHRLGGLSSTAGGDTDDEGDMRSQVNSALGELEA